MALHHAASSEIIDIRPLGVKLPTAVSTALVKTPSLEVMRVVLRAGKNMAQHQVSGEVTIQCVEGDITLHANNASQTLCAGDLVYLSGGVPHALHAISDASILLTILLQPAQGKQ